MPEEAENFKVRLHSLLTPPGPRTSNAAGLLPVSGRDESRGIARPSPHPKRVEMTCLPCTSRPQVAVMPRRRDEFRGLLRGAGPQVLLQRQQ